jgi:uncharacterized protein YegL
MTERMLRHKSTAWLAVAATAVTLGTLLFLSSLGTDLAPGTSAGAIPTSTPTPPPECLKSADVVIVIDTSGSMSHETGDPPQTRLYWAQQAATALVDGISGGTSSLGPHHVEVITFDGNGAAQLVGPALGNSDADAVRTAIAGITNPSGDTYIAKGIQKATTDLNAHTHSGSYKVVVLLSDGRNYANNDPMSGTTCNNTHDRRTKTVTAIGPLHDAADTVFTVGIGDQTGGANNCNPYELDTALLGDIAEGPPGYYKQVIDASTLPTVFQAIAWKIAGRALTE